jgi:hypothetical protein
LGNPGWIGGANWSGVQVSVSWSSNENFCRTDTTGGASGIRFCGLFSSVG